MLIDKVDDSVLSRGMGDASTEEAVSIGLMYRLLLACARLRACAASCCIGGLDHAVDGQAGPGKVRGGH